MADVLTSSENSTEIPTTTIITTTVAEDLSTNYLFNGVDFWEIVPEILAIIATVETLVIFVLNAFNWGLVIFKIVSTAVNLSTGNVVEAITNVVSLFV